jgi:hypothetical protein
VLPVTIRAWAAGSMKAAGLDFRTRSSPSRAGFERSGDFGSSLPGNVEQDDGEAGTGGEGGDAGPHGARADDSDLGDPHACSEVVVMRGERLSAAAAFAGLGPDHGR